MNKFLRILTTAVVGVGLSLLFLYLCILNNTDKSAVFGQPSYYLVQNDWYVFLAGCGCLAVSLVSCFLSWHKSMDTKIDILPNAVAAQKDEVVSWLSGSSLDTRKQENRQAVPLPDRQLTETADRTLSPGAADNTVCSAPTQQSIADNTVTSTDAEATVLEISCDTVLDNGPQTASDETEQV